MNVITDPWLIASIALVIVAAVVLVLLILPQQRRLLQACERPAGTAAPADRADRRLVVAVGVFNLIWAAVTVLMIVRPGSTTGA